MSGLTIGSVFRNAARATPGRPAAVQGGRSLTFGEVDRLADAWVSELLAAGLRAGDRVLSWTGTTLDVVPAFAALARMGAVYCPLPGILGAAEAASIAEVCRPALLLTDGEHAAAGRELAAIRAVPIVVIDDVVPRLIVPPEPYDDVPDERDPHVVFFTSGSTGRPKGVVLSHRVNYLRSMPGAQLEPRGAMVCVYPLFHMGAWTISLQQWQARAAVVYVPKPDGPAVCTAVRRHHATRLNAIPAVWQRVLDTLEAETDGLGPGRRTLPSIRFADSGTSATPPGLLARIARACPNAHLRVFYGSTEAGNVASLGGDEITNRPGSCGVPASATEVRIDAGSGELCVRGPLVFDGYLHEPTATAAALQDGWYHTGDLAQVDPDGYLSIVGRVADVIRTGGESVAPAEVEAALRDLPGAADLAVIGLPDEQWGELVCAVVVPSEVPPTLDDVRAWCTTRLASYKVPRVLHLVESLPRTPATGQIQRRRLVAALSANSALPADRAVLSPAGASEHTEREEEA
jgi:acyl-CoA synthetase (AMP-forming)/AMP-acid ligase II